MGAWPLFSKRELSAALQELEALLAATPQGARQVTVIGPKGGGTKTSTVAAVLHLLSDRVVGMVVGVDCNADKGTLTQRMGMASSQVPSRLLTLAQNPSTVQFLLDLSAYLDRVGRIHLLHNDGVPSRQVDRITREQYSELLVLLSHYAEITFVDTGTSMVHPSTLAALDGADHVVIAAAAEPPALQITTEGVAELVDLGYGPLISRSTIVATVTDPGRVRRLTPRAWTSSPPAAVTFRSSRTTGRLARSAPSAGTGCMQQRSWRTPGLPGASLGL